MKEHNMKTGTVVKSICEIRFMFKTGVLGFVKPGTFGHFETKKVIADGEASQEVYVVTFDEFYTLTDLAGSMKIRHCSPFRTEVLNSEIESAKLSELN